MMFILFGGAWLICRNGFKQFTRSKNPTDIYLPPVPQLPSYLEEPATPNPVQWLRDNTLLDTESLPAHYTESLQRTRPAAAFIALVRNSEVEAMVYSISQLEVRFNGRVTHQYDWVFFNNEEFTDEFKESVTNATSSQCYFEAVPFEHWSIPSWIDETRFDVGRQFMGSIGVGKAWLQSYHHMCRWNAGLFALEKHLLNYDWFWRVEPGVDFTCNINYDVFRFMQDNDMAYGFNMAILDDARSFPSLWERTQTFIKKNRDMVHEQADLDWLLHPAEVAEPQPQETDQSSATHKLTAKDVEYNNCQFYSNFEVGSLNFFRSNEHRAYFDHIDKTGGFYYERFGDAPVHTLSVSMFLPKRRIWFFRDIGYAHGLCEQCPPHEYQATTGPEPGPARPTPRAETPGLLNPHRLWAFVAKDVKRQGGIPGLACGCTVTAIDDNNSKLVPFESKQRKPTDPCIRLFLGGKWLEQSPDWNRDVDIAFGGDGQGGYILDGRGGNPSEPVKGT
ncbi:glycolipid 2-alpha-mannosyltransferase-domain-containing protein [Xylariomycetidae sp. FL2044]|nr:glycolipid 2-alpha-mannosyltransferase-domain-containing protein [Xylariomycetidae sp. FL2044]